MARTEDIPRAQNGCIKTSGADRSLNLRPHREVGFHGRSGLAYAQIDEVLHSSQTCCLHGAQAGDKVYLAKLLRLARTGMRHSHQLHEGVGRSNLRRVARSFQGITQHW